VVHSGQSHPQKKDLLNVLRWEQIYAQMLADPQGQSLMITDECECIWLPYYSVKIVELTVCFGGLLLS
jgi:hypothetical protein